MLGASVSIATMGWTVNLAHKSTNPRINPNNTGELATTLTDKYVQSIPTVSVTIYTWELALVIGASSGKNFRTFFRTFCCLCMNPVGLGCDRLPEQLRHERVDNNINYNNNNYYYY